MSEVKLVNETEYDIIVQEGSGGIFTPHGTIRKRQTYPLKVDSNDTYREYQCKLSYKISPKDEAVTLTSDDFPEYEQVTIKWDPTEKKLSYEAKKRQLGSNVAANKPSGQAATVTTKLVGLVRRFFNRFGGKKGQTPTDGGGGSGSGSGGGVDV